ncbi:MAG: type I-B CRISPR-associated protein Cas5b [Leptospiraceae bacterium]|nr:type I-B CRISPR-associated protein Cas5b [Leptospiraceae bacterium]
MTEKTLYIEIFQPYAQYRNPFTFYYAQSFPLPPKSTVIGMLQNATNRFYDEEFWKLRLSIHGGFESVYWNYQQFIKGYPKIEIKENKLLVVNQGLPLYNEGKKAQRTPVHQQELFNGYLYIFIRGKEDLIKEIYSALEKPKKVLSLGRSEDIVFVRSLMLFDEKDNRIKHSKSERSLWLTFPTYIKKEIKLNGNARRIFPIKTHKYPVYSISVFVAFYNNDTPIRNKAEIKKDKTERKVEFQTVIYTGFDYVIRLLEPVSYEEVTIDDKKFRLIEDFGWL